MKKFILAVVFLTACKSLAAVPDLQLDDLKRVTECRKLYLSVQHVGSYLMVVSPEDLDAIRGKDNDREESSRIVLPLSREFDSSVLQPHFGVYAIADRQIKVSILPKEAVYVMWNAKNDLTPTSTVGFKQDLFEIQLHPGAVKKLRDFFKFRIWRSDDPRTNIIGTREGYEINITRNFRDERESNVISLRVGMVPHYYGSKERGKYLVSPDSYRIVVSHVEEGSCAPLPLDAVIVGK